MKYLFCDTTWNQILRVGNKVAEEMKKAANVECLALVYETSGKQVYPDKDVNVFDDYLVTTEIGKIEAYIKENQPDVVIFAQNTIPDLAAILYSLQIGAKVVMMQHGLLYDGASLNNVRIGEIFAALAKARKTFDYFNILRVMCKHEHKSFLKAIARIVSEKDNVTTTIQNYFDTPLRGHIAFVIGQHWVDYYHDNYGYNKNDIYIMGNHDVDDLEDKEVEDAICYIPSVHVEDGHVTSTVFNDFLKALNHAIPDGVKFYIKLHPRSNRSIYEKAFEGRDVTIISGKELPYVNLYIGHNSSLLSKALQISGNVILWGFKEEKELFYKDFALSVCHDEVSLVKAVENALNNVSDKKKLDIGMYSYKNPIGAYRYCGNKILELYNQ